MFSLKKLDLSNNRHRLKQIFQFYRPDKRLIIWASILTFLGLGISLPVPFFYAHYLDSMIRYKDMILFRNLILIYIGLTLAKAGFQYIQQHLLIVFGQKVMYRIRRAMMKAILHTHHHYFQKNQSGYILSRIYEDINNLDPIFPGTFLNLANRIISLLVSAVLIFLINWQLALFAFAISPLFFLNNFIFGKYIILNSRKVREIWAQLYGKTQEMIAGAYTIKCFNRENAEVRYYCRQQKPAIKSIVKLLVLNNISSSIAIFTQGIAPLLLFFYAFYIYLDNGITLGQIFAFVYYILRFYGPVMYVYHYILRFQNMLPSLVRANEILDLEREETISTGYCTIGPVASNGIPGSLRFENVDFSYNGKAILKDLSFQVRHRELVALVGHSGSGKTTVTNLLLGYYQPLRGNIYVGNENIVDIPLRKLRATIGVVAQDIFLFNRTVHENIAFGNPEATIEQIHTAAQRANIHDFILTLPEGYDTIVGEGGNTLSRGERQRVCIARTLLRNPAIIIFDEATSSLDSDSQKMIHDTIYDISKQATVLWITHKLASLKCIDKILFLQSGSIIESGDHESLITLNGQYKKQYELAEF